MLTRWRERPRRRCITGFVASRLAGRLHQPLVVDSAIVGFVVVFAAEIVITLVQIIFPKVVVFGFLVVSFLA